MADCAFPFPSAYDDASEFPLLSLRFVESDTSSDLEFLDGAAACSEFALGWYPLELSEEIFVALCPAACEQLQSVP